MQLQHCVPIFSWDKTTLYHDILQAICLRYAMIKVKAFLDFFVILEYKNRLETSGLF